MRQVPVLFLSDNPTLQSGLARITRDLAGQLTRNPKFRVGTMGMCGQPSRKLPFAQYTFPQDGTWGAPYFRSVWEDFAGKERGIVLTIWDSTRTLWLTRPEYCGDSELEAWLRQDHFSKWGYVTMDATGPQDKLSQIGAASLMGYDRLLAYTKWSAGVIERTIGSEAAKAKRLDWLPHGIDFNKFTIRDREEAKARLFPFLHEGDRLVGVIGTNQPRKDWGLAASVCQQLAAKDRRLRLWFNTDLLERYWSMHALVHDFGLHHVTQVTTSLKQDDLIWMYNACDLTIHPGLGEGFGYPVFESLACGTPILHGDYAGGADLLRQAHWDDFLVEPVTWRLDGLHNCVRPVFHPNHWVDAVERVLAEDYNREALRASIAHLSWGLLWPSCFSRWFEEGIE